MKETLELGFDLDTISPVVLHTMFLEEVHKKGLKDVYQKKVFDSYEKASKGMDIMIIEGPRVPGIGSALELDIVSIAKKLESYLLLVARIETDADADQIVREGRWVRALDADFMGGILNYIPEPALEVVRNYMIPILEKNKVRILGVIPDNVRLRAPSVKEIYDVLGGRVLAAKDKLDKLVEDFLVGAMTPESALRYFRRTINKAVITGGDRPDIQHAALQTSLSALILTGNLYPDIRVLSRAEELGVPVLLVPYDTYTTVMKIATIAGRIRPSDKRKIDLAKALVERYVDWKAILKKLIA